jgi:hypothetical protein
LEISSVVAHFLDGKVVKGVTQDFLPPTPAFHVATGPTEFPVQVRCSQLKALFFVRDLEGNPQRSDLRGFIAGPPETTHGRKIAVRFPDGELLCGYSHSYSPRRPGFFIFPADPGSNNLRVFVNVSPGTEVKVGSAAEELAQRTLDSRAA